MSAKYCFFCDAINVVFKKDRTIVQYMSNGVVVREQENTSFANPRPGDSLKICVTSTLPCENGPPTTYTVEDLMKMMESRK